MDSSLMEIRISRSHKDGGRSLTLMECLVYRTTLEQAITFTTFWAWNQLS